MLVDECIKEMEAVWETPVAAPPQKPEPPRSPAEASIAILGVNLDPVTLDETVQRIDQMVQSRQPHYVVTVNADFLVQARRDAELHRILLDAHLVLCDGTPLVWASQWLGNSVPERVAGSDLVPVLIRAAAEKGYRIFFLGGQPDVTAQAIRNLMAQYPALNIVGHCSPPFKPLLEWGHAEISRKIRAAQPDLLFISLGAPKAEKWMAMHYRALGVPVMMGVGATIDFLAGRVKRAPMWMRRSGTEWIFRWVQEPRRLFRRYLSDLWHFPRAILAQWWKMRFCWRRPALPLRASSVLVEPTWRRIQLPEHWDAASVRMDAELWEQAASESRHCLVELARVKFIDGTGIALLIRLKKQLRKAGRELVLLAPSVQAQRTIALMRLGDFFAVASDALEAREIIGSRGRERAPVLVNGSERPLAWQGEITGANTKEVWDATRQQIKVLRSRRKQAPIDLSAVRFIDTAGISLMARVKKYARRQGVTLQFVGAQSSVRKALSASNLKSPLLEEGA
jgi:N-acetylglucosaminyldiphosphoundecaprenol N-acetyl-beta-D-mannosaminyltransferase